MSDRPMSRRAPWIAVALSLLSAGIGHVYCGRIVKGLLFYFAWFVVPALGFIAALFRPSTEMLILFLLIPAAGVMLIYIYAALEAYLIAKQTGDSYRLKDYNRTGFYTLLVLVYLICPISLVAAVRSFAYEAFYIPTSSMSPSIVKGDRVLVNKIRPRKHYPDRGAMVVFRNPGPEGGGAFIKRVVAVAGDHVVMKGNEVEINGKLLDRDRLPIENLGELNNVAEANAFYEANAGKRYKVLYAKTENSQTGQEESEIDMVVPDRSVFVLGDNRNISRDSRHFGSIHLGDVIGYVDYIYYPAHDWSRFGVCQD